MVDFGDSAYQQYELYYVCLDTTPNSLERLFNFVEAFGIETHLRSAALITSLFTFITRLGVYFKFHGAFLSGWPTAVSLPAYDMPIPGY